jgi:hypothetical protein
MASKMANGNGEIISVAINGGGINGARSIMKIIESENGEINETGENGAAKENNERQHQ